MEQACIFCQIAAGEADADRVYETGSVLAFRDTNPQAPTHILIVPKKHIPRLADLQPEDFDAVLEMNPALVLLGTGARQRFPSAAAMAALLTRGIGLEVMDTAAAARTFNVLATEGRRVVAGFLLPG